MARKRPDGDGLVRKRKDGRWEGRIVIGHKEDGTPIYKMSRSLLFFSNGLTPNDRYSISASLRDSLTKVYQFINFNYTTVFDELVEEVFTSPEFVSEKRICKPIIHIHGKLDDNVVLGVDNELQLSELPYQLSYRSLRNIIKPTFVDAYDIERKRTAFSYIKLSDVICVYGLSLGESDLTWRKAIADWLLVSDKNHLVIYFHSLSTKEYAKGEANQKMDDEEDCKGELIDRLFDGALEGDEYHLVFKQIHIPTGSDIFNLSEVSSIYVKGAEVATPPVLS